MLTQTSINVTQTHTHCTAQGGERRFLFYQGWPCTLRRLLQNVLCYQEFNYVFKCITVYIFFMSGESFLLISFSSTVYSVALLLRQTMIRGKIEAREICLNTLHFSWSLCILTKPVMASSSIIHPGFAVDCWLMMLNTSPTYF